MPVSQGVFEPLSSEGKAVGLSNFLNTLDRFLVSPRPSKVELPIIHRIATSGADHGVLPPEVRQHAMEVMLAEELCASRAEFHDMVASIRSNGFSSEKGSLDVRHKNERKIVNYRTTVLRRGHIRQNGVIQVNKGPEKASFASHVKPYITGDLRESYIGLSTNLDLIFNDLCDAADAHMAAAETLEEKLKAITFMQLWGSSVVHPFFDGNGRTFGAKLLLDLNRMGLPAKTIPGLPELADLRPEVKENMFASVGPYFTQIFLEQSELGLIPAEESRFFIESPDLIKPYMERLERSIRTGFEAGPNAEGYMGQFVEMGAYVLNLVLSRDGLLDRSFYEERIDEFVSTQREAIAAAKAEV